MNHELQFHYQFIQFDGQSSLHILFGVRDKMRLFVVVKQRKCISEFVSLPDLNQII